MLVLIGPDLLCVCKNVQTQKNVQADLPNLDSIWWIWFHAEVTVSHLYYTYCKVNVAAVWVKMYVFCPSHLQTLPPPYPCWSFTSSLVWWRVAWCSAGAAGHPVGSCGESAFVASYPAVTRHAPPASSAPAAAPTARSTDWPKSPLTHRSTGRQQERPPPPPTVLKTTLPLLLFRAQGAVWLISFGIQRQRYSMLMLSCDQWWTWTHTDHDQESLWRTDKVNVLDKLCLCVLNVMMEVMRQLCFYEKVKQGTV